MRLARAASLLAGLALFAGKGSASAQQPATVPPPPREQVHPELVDTTWGPAMAAAWQLAFAHRWNDARARFTELHTAHPSGVDAMLGLGFVARATGHADEARQWYQRAYAVEPSDAVRTQLEAAEVDRAASVDISGVAERVGSTTTADWSIAGVFPVDQWLAITARAGVVGAGDPLRGVLLDSTAGSPARVLSAGAVGRPTDALTLGARVEFWSAAGEGQTFVWFDGTQRLDDHFAIRLGARPLGGSTGSPQVTGGADVIFVPSQVLSFDAFQGSRAAPFESRTEVRASYFGAITPRQSLRVGLVRDTGPANQATTGFAGGSWLFTPTLGVRLDVSTRRGAFARSSAGGGLVVRW